MAQEMVRSISQAELDASKSIRDAMYQADMQTCEAKKEAEQIKADMVKEMIDKAEQTIAMAKQKNESAMEDAIQRAQNEITQLKEQAYNRKAEVIKLVIAQVV